MRLLFLLKEKNSYGGTLSTIESGLLNSARMTMKALEERLDVQGRLKICFDGNSINKEIHDFRPKVVIIEAIWVTPDKLKQLTKLHPGVSFIVRIHSEVPFISNEGNAIEWIKGYAAIPNIKVAFNSERTSKDFNHISDLPFYYLPNIYEKIKDKPSIFDFFETAQKIPRILNVGCFGAVRPMKNQLEQAVAAMTLANRYRSTLYFHINAERVEQDGQPVLKNIRSLFKDTNHVLIEHPWLSREDFLKTVKKMDAGMQVSMNESFNIVTADFVQVGIPIIVSPSISWMPTSTQVSIEDTKEIARGLELILTYPKSFAKTSRRYLINYNKMALNTWRNFLYD